MILLHYWCTIKNHLLYLTEKETNISSQASKYGFIFSMVPHLQWSLVLLVLRMSQCQRTVLSHLFTWLNHFNRTFLIFSLIEANLTILFTFISYLIHICMLVHPSYYSFFVSLHYFHPFPHLLNVLGLLTLDPSFWKPIMIHQISAISRYQIQLQ